MNYAIACNGVGEYEFAERLFTEGLKNLIKYRGKDVYYYTLYTYWFGEN